MQQQANRERVIVRTSLPGNLPQVIADARSVRQIALNLLSNSIKFTGAGGQIIISTTQTDAQEVVLRVRDTGTGMSEKELQTALEPFRQVARPPFGVPAERASGFRSPRRWRRPIMPVSTSAARLTTARWQKWCSRPAGCWRNNSKIG